MGKTYKKNSDDNWEYKRRQEDKKREKGQNKKKFLYEKPTQSRDNRKEY